MIEVNSAVHEDVSALEEDLDAACAAVCAAAGPLGVRICGGGAHPFRDWPRRDIFPTQRFEELEQTYGYLARQFTVFGQHVHVGVPCGDDAIRLTHWFNRFVPHLIALSAASPFQRGVDTSFQSTRVNVATLFPLSGHMPACRDWGEFAEYFARMKRTGLVRSMKDFYWDVRPKPEFGTVEIRVLDTPLSVRHAADLACFVRSLAEIGLEEATAPRGESAYEAYPVNRFSAARFGFDATLRDTARPRSVRLRDDLKRWLDRCLVRSRFPGDADRLRRLRARVVDGLTDSNWMRQRAGHGRTWAALLREASAQLLDPARRESPAAAAGGGARSRGRSAAIRGARPRSDRGVRRAARARPRTAR
jgi:carboxylate-amine ligase